MRITVIPRIDHVSIAVRDQKKAERFFRDILGPLPASGCATLTMAHPDGGKILQDLKIGDGT